MLDINHLCPLGSSANTHGPHHCSTERPLILHPSLHSFWCFLQFTVFSAITNAARIAAQLCLISNLEYQVALLLSLYRKGSIIPHEGERERYSSSPNSPALLVKEMLHPYQLLPDLHMTSGIIHSKPLCHEIVEWYSWAPNSNIMTIFIHSCQRLFFFVCGAFKMEVGK